jgi:alpha-galactosidase
MGSFGHERWGADAGGNLWRTTSDIRDGYSEMSSNGFTQAGLSRYAGPGHWNDPDMLEVGNGGMKIDGFYRTQMSLWAILAAPLIASNDLRNMTSETHDILLNRDVIAVDQASPAVTGATPSKRRRKRSQDS